jgi:hypothetical protein
VKKTRPPAEDRAFGISHDWRFAPVDPPLHKFLNPFLHSFSAYCFKQTSEMETHRLSPFNQRTVYNTIQNTKRSVNWANPIETYGRKWHLNDWQAKQYQATLHYTAVADAPENQTEACCNCGGYYQDTDVSLPMSGLLELDCWWIHWNENRVLIELFLMFSTRYNWVF